MHARSISRKKQHPEMASVTDDWSAYEYSWTYLMLFIIAAIFVPQKL